MSQSLAAMLEVATADAAAEDLLPHLYTELRRLARRRLQGRGAAASVDATGLVHEAYLRLAGESSSFRGRAHFLAAAALAMRHVLVDHARRRQRLRRGGGRAPVVLATEPAAPGGGADVVDVLDLEQGLAALEAAHPRPARVVTLRYFGGLTAAEIGAVLGVADATVERDWSFARAFLHRALGGAGDGNADGRP